MARLAGLLLPHLFFTAVPAITVAARQALFEATPLVIAMQDYYANDPNSTFINGLPGPWDDPKIDLDGGAEVHVLHDAPVHPDLRIISTVAEVYYRIVANKKANIRTMADLKGKRIGVIGNSTSEYFAYRYLHEVVGLQDSDYTFVSRTGASGLCSSEPCKKDSFPYMLQHGEVDAVTAYEPSTELTIRAIGEENAVVFQNNSLYRELSVLYTTQGKLDDPATRKEIVKFLRALNKVQKVFADEPSKIWSRVLNITGVSLGSDVMEKIWPLTKWSGGLPDDMLDILVEEDKWIARDPALRRGPMSRATLATHIDPSPLKEALEQE